MKLKFIPAYLEPETIAAVDLIAKHKQVPRSAVIRGIIEEHVDRVGAAALQRFGGIPTGVPSLRPTRTGDV
jgi:hypothetical protein